MNKKIIIYIFCGYSSRCNKMKKKMSENFFFAEEAGAGMGYCPFSSLSHDIMDCIVT